MPVITDADPSDDTLIASARAGDRAAFASLFRRHQAIVYRFARAMCGSAATAEDVTQEVFLALLTQLERYDASRATLPVYLYGVARNMVRRRMRRARWFLDRPVAPDDLAVTGDMAGELAHAQRLARLRAMVTMLPVKYRETLILCDLQEVDYADAAAILGVPVGTVRSRLHRARRLLGERVRRHEARAAVVVRGTVKPAKCVS